MYLNLHSFSLIVKFKYVAAMKIYSGNLALDVKNSEKIY